MATPAAIETWSLTSLKERLINTDTRLVRHARYAIFQFAEAALPRTVFAGILGLINDLRGPPTQTACAWQGLQPDRRNAALVKAQDCPAHAKSCSLRYRPAKVAPSGAGADHQNGPQGRALG
jgi:hypothetical protein